MNDKPLNKPQNKYSPANQLAHLLKLIKVRTAKKHPKNPQTP